jgi:AraC-like DNA-binding protein
MQKLPVHPLLTGIVGQALLTRHSGADSYKVLPSIYTVIGFQFSGRLHHVGENRPLSTFGVTGILDTWRPFRSDASTQSLLIFFNPGGFYRLFGAVASELGSASLALRDVAQAAITSDFTDILSGAGSIAEKWRLLQERFLKLLGPELSPESQGALYYLKRAHGTARIEDIAAELGVSRRTLERKFAAEIGTPPKHLARILRWRQAMKNLADYADLSTAALAHGYFDQAHFIRETQSLSGSTPSKLDRAVF